MIFIFIFIII